MLKNLLTRMSITKDGKLMRAAMDGNYNKVKALLNSGTDPNCRIDSGLTPIYSAVLSGNIEVVKLLIDHNANPNIRFNENNAIIQAVEHQYSDIIKLLIKAGVDLEQGDSVGNYTPLFLATSVQNLEIVKILLEAGANPNAMGNEGEQILAAARISGDKNIIQILIKYGAEEKIPRFDINEKGKVIVL